MMRSIKATLALGLFGSADAAIQWDSTYGKSPDRRLALGLVNSHNDTADAGCIVGGYDPDHPARIYVGGPCSLISNGVPQTGFRWVVMETVDAQLAGTDGSTVDMVAYTTAKIPNPAFQHSADHTTHAEAGAGISMHFPSTEIEHASLFLSTTSYLAKADFPFTTNDFVIEVDSQGNKDFIQGVCVTPCAGATSTTPVTCTTCPSTPISATKGMYKYSILAASWNYENSAAPTTKGWQKIVETYGVADSTGNKALEGNLNVYQAIDFTNMNADTLTITSTNGSSVTYAQMDPCNMATFKSATDSSRSCSVYSVSSVLVESDGWAGSYAFPLTFNVGSWTKANDDAPVTPAMGGTRTVHINCVRPMDANLQAVGMAANSKAIYLEYKFSVNGIYARLNEGGYMVYDPTITTGSGASGANTPGTVSGNSNATKASTSKAGRIACEPAVVIFTTMLLAALSGFM